MKCKTLLFLYPYSELAGVATTCSTCTLSSPGCCRCGSWADPTPSPGTVFFTLGCPDPLLFEAPENCSVLNHMIVAEKNRQLNRESLGKLTIRFVGCCRSPLAFQFPVVLPLVPPVPLRHPCQRLSESSDVFICVFLSLPLPKRVPWLSASYEFFCEFSRHWIGWRSFGKLSKRRVGSPCGFSRGGRSGTSGWSSCHRCWKRTLEYWLSEQIGFRQHFIQTCTHTA